jgi:hypothetical protein
MRDFASKQRPGQRRSVAQPSADSRKPGSPTTTSAASGARFGHDFSRIAVFSPSSANTSKAGESGSDDLVLLDEEHRMAQSGGSGSGSGSGGGSAAAAPSASLSITGDGSYVDTATESRKNVKFNVTWSGGNKEDYIIVNWLKGSMLKSSGTPYKVQMYGSSVDFNFSDWQVDSMDADPAYWSSGGTRWRYTVDAADKFHATDSPGPMYTSDGVGAKANVDFKTAVYKSSDVPTTTSGTISATPLSSFQTWSYHVEVLGGGKFKH